MKKIVLGAVAAAVIATGVQAEETNILSQKNDRKDSYLFIGVNANFFKATVEENGYLNYYSGGYSYYNNATTSKKIDDTAFGITIGAVANNTHRVTIGVTRYDFEYDSELREYGLYYDYLFSNSKNFVPYIGLHISYGEASMYDDLIHDNGWLFGFQGGVIYDITPHWQVEIAAKVTKSSLDPSFYGNLNSGSNSISASYQIDLDTLYIGTVAINYKF